MHSTFFAHIGYSKPYVLILTVILILTSTSLRAQDCPKVSKDLANYIYSMEVSEQFPTAEDSLVLKFNLEGATPEMDFEGLLNITLDINLGFDFEPSADIEFDLEGSWIAELGACHATVQFTDTRTVQFSFSDTVCLPRKGKGQIVEIRIKNDGIAIDHEQVVANMGGIVMIDNIMPAKAEILQSFASQEVTAISNEGPLHRLELINQQGEFVRTKESIPARKLQFNTNGLPKGIYILRLYRVQGPIEVRKILVIGQ